MENKEVTIKALLNGPLHISGNIELIGSTGGKIKTKGDVFLCRCGNSQNKPFCDGSHKTHGFRET